MNEPFLASPNQCKASNPAQSVWVSANAGSGKTHVLVDRVIRLMLKGCDPSRVLCLTFTKAAAAEMANRLFEKLSVWTTLPDGKLLAHMEAIGHEHVSTADLERARKLFTVALESPGGLKIQTIHAFCELLLQRFPVEAGVVPGFTVMDDVLAAATLAEARQNVLSAADDGSLASALERIVARVQADAFDKLVSTILNMRLEIAGVLSSPQAVEAAVEELRVLGGLLPADSPERVMERLVACDEVSYKSAIAILMSGTPKTDRKNAQALQSALDEKNPEKRLDGLRKVFFTKELELCKPTKLITRKLATAHPDVHDFLCTEQQRVFEGLGLLSLFSMLDANRDLLTLASGIVAEFGRLKRERGLYDFTDLIEHTCKLLTRSSSAAWVLYKLDGGFDHILVDEAQDTSRAQWEIARALAEEPFSGTGARSEIDRTLFVVGDRKQSIFSFQGADPASFDESRRHFERLITGAEKRFEPVELFDSYRSVSAVLKAVDCTFESPLARQGLEASLDIAIKHYATRKDKPGIVEVWPLIEVDDLEKPGPLDPVDILPRNHPRRKLAAMVADKIASWIGKRRIPALGRTVEPGDILILVRSRNPFFDAMIAELNARRIPVAGADRLKLGEHIAVKDLLSLARFVILPDDDLSLAEVLKSPLMPKSFNDEDLYGIAHGRGGISLWDSLHASRHREAVTFLDGLIACAATATPFEFFNRVLLSGEPSGRKRIYARLGPEAADAIDAFLALVLDDELSRTPSLQGFVSRFEAESIEIKRDMQNGGGEVRIMTVHGAKGLEASIVIIPDCAELPSGNSDMTLLKVDCGDGRLPLPFWRCKCEVEPAAVTRWKEQTRERLMNEYRRSLYVALTRARDELYVGGVVTRGQLKDESWYALVRDGLRSGLNIVADSEGTYRYIDGEVRVTAEEKTPPPPVLTGDLEDWARRPPRHAINLRPWIRPTDPVNRKDSESGRSPLDPNEIRRFRRGTLIHKLLQILPDLPAERRASVAENFLRRHDTEIDQIPLIRHEVLNLLTAEEFAPFFGEGSLAEVSFASLIGDLHRHVSGRIDRLAIAPDAIHVVDFKTDRFPPLEVSDVDPVYIGQLAVYARALRAIYPGRKVNAALLWTADPRLMVVPEALLE
jgi:ATP-dependent helicase/nuclease subunit A